MNDIIIKLIKLFYSIYSIGTLQFPGTMAPKNNYHATEIRSLRTEIEEKDEEIAQLKAALDKANERKDVVNIEAITKKIRDEVWLDNRNKVAALEKKYVEENAAYRKENAILKSKIQFQEKRIEEWKHIGDKTAGPARVHQQLRQEEADHAKTKEELRKLQGKYDVALKTVCTVNHNSSDTLQKYEMENHFLRTNLDKKEETIQELSSQMKKLQQLCGQLHNTIQTLNSAVVRRESVLYRYMYAKTKTTLETYHLPDIATVLREMAINGNIAMIVRVNKDTYDLVIKSGISQGIPQWMFFNNIAKVLGIDIDNVLFTMPINDNHYSVIMTDQAPVNISL